MLRVHLPEALEHRLSQLAEKTRCSKSYYLKEALQIYLDAFEVELLAVAEYEEDVQNGNLKTISLEEIKKKLKLTNYDLED